MKVNKKDIQAAIATNRFGLGAHPNEILLAISDPQKWLINSLSNINPPSNAPKAIEMIRLWSEHKKQKQSKKKITNISMSMEQKPATTQMMNEEKSSPNKVLKQNAGLIISHAIKSQASINWRLLDFFSNHFSVSGHNTGMRFLAPTLDWEAIAPNLMGNFSDMLIAVISHPAMLLYLNNEKSIGPNSIQGKKRSKRGLNENLAREILELHTLGVDNGYSQQDIVELAKAISGWSIARHTKETEYSKENAFIFRADAHEPGSRVILNKRYLENTKSPQQGKMILTDLANSPATASHVCTKLARHFVSDTPNPRLIKQMTRTWLKTQGNLKAVISVLIKSKFSWQTKTHKYKSPREFMISSYRAIGGKIPDEKTLSNYLHQLGQEPYQAGSPAGFGDLRNTWDGSDALFNRIEWSAHISKQVRNVDVVNLAKIALGENIKDHTLQILKRAESQEQAISLFLMSPDFLQR